MAISVTCGDCGESFRVSDQMVGKRVKCKSCGSTIVVKEDAPVRAAPPVSRKRPGKKATRSRASFDWGKLKVPLILVVAIGTIGGAIKIGSDIYRQAAEAARRDGQAANERALDTTGGQGTGGAVAARLDNGWVAFQVPEAGVAMEAPGAMGEKPQQRNMREYRYLGQGYDVSLAWGPLTAEQTANPELVFDTYRKSRSAQLPGAKVETMKVDGQPALLMDTSDPDRHSVRNSARICVNRERLVMVIISFSASPDDSISKRVFDSIKFTQPKDVGTAGDAPVDIASIPKVERGDPSPPLQNGWSVTTGPQGAFRIHLPGKPEQRMESSGRTLAYSLDADDLTFGLKFYEGDESYIQTIHADIQKNVGLVSEQDFEWQGHKARQFRFRAPMELPPGIAWVVVDGKMVLTIHINFLKKEPNLQKVQWILHSLRFGDSARIAEARPQPGAANAEPMPEPKPVPVAAGWKTFTPPNAPFSIDAPEDLAWEVDKSGPATTTMYRVKTDQYSLAASWITFPSIPGDPATVLKTMTAQGNQGNTGEPFREVEHAGKNGVEGVREIRGTYPKSRARIFLSGKTLITIQLDYKTTEPTEIRQTFFGSLRFTGEASPSGPVSKPALPEVATTPSKPANEEEGTDPRSVKKTDKLEPGTPLEAKWGTGWSPVVVTSVRKSEIRIQYLGSLTRGDEPVARALLRHPDDSEGKRVTLKTPLKPGREAEAYWGSSWRKVKILRLKGNSVFVHWDGESDAFDSEVSKVELRLPAEEEKK